MLIFGDARLPQPTKQKLSAVGTFVPFMTENLVYEAIAGHPDIFFCQDGNKLVVAPNLPEKYFHLLKQHSISFTKGVSALKNKYPGTARYNAVVSKRYLIHHPTLSDPELLNTFKEKKVIPVKQGYVRCNLLPLKNEVFITSDKGILKALQKASLEVHYFSPEGIYLQGFQHGFLGGCLGLLNDTIFITGRLSTYPEGKRLSHLLTGLGYRIEELHDGPLVDGGGIFFFEENKKAGKPE